MYKSVDCVHKDVVNSELTIGQPREILSKDNFERQATKNIIINDRQITTKGLLLLMDHAKKFLLVYIWE